jgi:chaperonin cofactor prefoldin
MLERVQSGQTEANFINKEYANKAADLINAARNLSVKQKELGRFIVQPSGITLDLSGLDSQIASLSTLAGDAQALSSTSIQQVQQLITVLQELTEQLNTLTTQVNDMETAITSLVGGSCG